MGAGLLILLIFLIGSIILGLVIGVPIVLDFLSRRSDNYKGRYLTERRDKNIAYRALREILSTNGDGAALIAEIAVNQIDSNEIKELN